MAGLQPQDNQVSTDNWALIRFSKICHLEIVNLNSAAFLISPNSSGTPSYTIEGNSERVWDLSDSEEVSYLYVKSAAPGVPASFKMIGF